VLGFLAALLGGIATQVSGPTGPMTVVMTALLAVLSRRYGFESALPLALGIAALAGLLQVLLGVTAALAMETLCLDSQQQGRSVVIVVSADQPLARLERIGVARIQGVSILPSRDAALQQALSHS
jgi:SulP family sulfate permease